VWRGAALLVALTLSARAQSPAEALCGRFAGVPPQTLASTLDPATLPPELPAGVEMTVTTRPVGDLGGVLVEGLLANRGSAAARVDPLPILSLSFRLGQRPDDQAFEPLGYRTEEWYGSTFWMGAEWTRVGKDWQHPGENTPSVRRFVAPRDGRVRVTGRVCKLHLDGDGIRATILHGEKQVWQAELEGKDSTGAEPSLDLDVRAGDRLRFVIHKRGTISCDTTQWDPVVTYSDGAASQASASFGRIAGKGGWFYEQQTADPAESHYRALTYSTGTWYGSTFWTGPDWTRVGKDWHHPGENTASVRRFTVPRDGRVRVAGRVGKLHLEGDGIRALILHGEQQVWQAEIEGKDETGVEPALDLEVRQGDHLRFVVHKRGGIACDTTHWDPSVTYADGTVFLASVAFGETPGKDGWFYEMVTGELPAIRPPRLVALGRDLAPRLTAVQPEGTVVIDERDGLPFLLLADGADASGLALAMEPTPGWRLVASRPEALTCQVTLSGAAAQLEPGATLPLPRVLVMPYDGRWSAGQTRLAAAALADSDADGLPELRQAIAAAAATATQDMQRPPEPTLLLMAIADWYRDDGIQETPESYAAAVAAHLARARALLGELSAERSAGYPARLEAVAARAAQTELPLEQWRSVYLQVRTLKRDLALAAPEVGTQPLLICKRRPPNYSHQVMQYYGWRQQPGGGLFALEDPGVSLRTRDLTTGKLPPGSYLEPRLSYDATQVVFSHVAVAETPIDPASLAVNEEGPDEAYFHVYTMGSDGTGLRQLTTGTYDDVMPTWLPDGGVAFCSTRRQAYSRCFGGQFSKRWDSYTIYRMAVDGSALRQLSWNDVNEWFPEVSNAGTLIFARWDYIDRDAVTHQNLWSMRPDGTNQMAIWGNATPNPHCTFQAKAIPDSGKLIFVASAHHSVTGGPLCLFDPAVDSNSAHAALTRLTPQRFPESEGSIEDYYNSPWPLSERRFLVAYSPEPLRFEPAAQPDNVFGIYLLDAAGNRELLYRDPLISSTNPTPLRPRPAPPVLASTLVPEAPPTAELVVTDIYRGLGDVPRGTIRALRVIQILPKTTPISNLPPIGLAGEENTRAVLGTVPVEADGSARFLVPSGKAIFFQALDERGDAYQTMRSTTALQAGEKTSCSGCHENRMSVAPATRPLAQAHPPAALRVGPFDGRPFSYMDVVQPVWDKHCLSCHGAEAPKGGINLTATARDGFAESYWSLCGSLQAFWGGATNPENAAKALVPRFGARNRIEVTPPGGIYGARGSRLLKILRDGHEKVVLTDAELRRIATWIDCNAIFYGSYFPAVQAQELAGKAPPMPEIQ
jgi:hypothetical protein